MQAIMRAINSFKTHLERYRSGHNGTDSKSVGGSSSHVGSNPTLSARKQKTAKGGFFYSVID